MLANSLKADDYQFLWKAPWAISPTSLPPVAYWEPQGHAPAWAEECGCPSLPPGPALEEAGEAEAFLGILPLWTWEQSLVSVPAARVPFLPSPGGPWIVILGG